MDRIPKNFPGRPKGKAAIVTGACFPVDGGVTITGSATELIARPD